jgi:hypothetical protein
MGEGERGMTGYPMRRDTVAEGQRVGGQIGVGTSYSFRLVGVLECTVL